MERREVSKAEEVGTGLWGEVQEEGAGLEGGSGPVINAWLVGMLCREWRDGTVGVWNSEGWDTGVWEWMV